MDKCNRIERQRHDPHRRETPRTIHHHNPLKLLKDKGILSQKSLQGDKKLLRFMSLESKSLLTTNTPLRIKEDICGSLRDSVNEKVHETRF